MSPSSRSGSRLKRRRSSSGFASSSKSARQSPDLFGLKSGESNAVQTYFPAVSSWRSRAGYQGGRCYDALQKEQRIVDRRYGKLSVEQKMSAINREEMRRRSDIVVMCRNARDEGKRMERKRAEQRREEEKAARIVEERKRRAQACATGIVDLTQDSPQHASLSQPPKPLEDDLVSDPDETDLDIDEELRSVAKQGPYIFQGRRPATSIKPCKTSNTDKERSGDSDSGDSLDKNDEDYEKSKDLKRLRRNLGKENVRRKGDRNGSASASPDRYSASKLRADTEVIIIESDSEAEEGKDELSKRIRERSSVPVPLAESQSEIAIRQKRAKPRRKTEKKTKLVALPKSHPAFQSTDQEELLPSSKYGSPKSGGSGKDLNSRPCANGSSNVAESEVNALDKLASGAHCGRRRFPRNRFSRDSGTAALADNGKVSPKHGSHLQSNERNFDRTEDASHQVLSKTSVITIEKRLRASAGFNFKEILDRQQLEENNSTTRSGLKKDHVVRSNDDDPQPSDIVILDDTQDEICPAMAYDNKRASRNEGILHPAASTCKMATPKHRLTLHESSSDEDVCTAFDAEGNQDCSADNRLKGLNPGEKGLVARMTVRVPRQKVLATIPAANIILRGEDFSGLRGCRWLNDEVINAFAALVNSRNETFFAGREQQRRANPESDGCPDKTVEKAFTDSDPHSFSEEPSEVIDNGNQNKAMEDAGTPKHDNADVSLLFEQKRPKAHMFNTFFYTRLSQNGYDYSGVRRWTKRASVSVADIDLLMFPVNLNNRHWVLAVIDFRARQFVYLDSMYGVDTSDVLHTLRRWLHDEVVDKFGEERATEMEIDDWDFVFNPEYLPRQLDEGSCGVFTLYTADYLELGRKPNFAQEHIQILRKRTVIYLTKGKLPAT